MIYEKEKTKNNLLDPDEYRIAEKDIEIKNYRDGILVIDKGTVFTVESRFMMNIYEVVFKTFGFTKTVTKYGELVSVQKVKIQRFAEDEYNELLYRLSKDTDSMKKGVFEQKLLQHSEVCEFLEKIEALRNKNYQVRLASVNAVQKAPRSDDNSLSDIVLKGISTLAAKIENNPAALRIVTLSNVILGSFFAHNILKMVIFIDAFVSSQFSLFSLFVNMMGIVLCMINLILKPIRASEVYKIFLKMIFTLINGVIYIDSNRSYDISDIRGKFDIAGGEFISIQQAQLHRTLDEHFTKIAFDVFVSAGSQHRNYSNASQFADSEQQNSMPAISPLGSFSAEPQKETETRTEQEIIGGYERVAFPRYKSDADNGSSTNSKGSSGGRKMINLDKNAYMSGKKVSLEKPGSKPVRKKISLTKNNDDTNSDARENTNINKMFM